MRKQIGTHTIVLADVRQQYRVGGGGGLAGPFLTLRVPCASRGRVAEWPVTDPILPVLVPPQDNAMGKSIARLRPGERSRRRPFRQDPASG